LLTNFSVILYKVSSGDKNTRSEDENNTCKMKYKIIFLRILYTHLHRLQAVGIHNPTEDSQQDMLQDTLVEEVESLVGVEEEKCHRHHHRHPQR